MNYDRTKYKMCTWKNPITLFWIATPIFAVNELLFGLRVPKISLLERNKTKTLSERTWIPCPHCQTLHSGLKWSEQNKTAFKNWFGYYCDNCGKIIPCLMNLTSFIILAVTFPFWFGFKDKLKAKWIENQKVRFSKPLILTQEIVEKWWIEGIGHGVLFFILGIFFNRQEMTMKTLLLVLVISMIGGLIMGLINNFLIKGVHRRQKQIPDERNL